MINNVELYNEDISKSLEKNSYDELKNKYKVMSVPCLVVNEEQVYFGKKNINQLLDLI